VEIFTIKRAESPADPHMIRDIPDEQYVEVPIIEPEDVFEDVIEEDPEQPMEELPPHHRIAIEFRIWIISVYGHGIEGVKRFFAEKGQVAGGRTFARMRSRHYLHDVKKR
jgi:hypothetical protein